MRDFSIDKSADQIKISETKENFKEVLSCYYNENYRAAVVLLYSVVISDILFKLKNLEETYNDTKAIGILNTIKRLQADNPTSSQWEDDLIHKVQEQTNLIDLSEKSFIQNLKSLRHLCAHPVLSQNYNLFNPNKETVKAHIRNMLECVLLKPSFFSRVIFDDFIQDIAFNKDILIDDESLSKYLKIKYIENFNDITLFSVFKSLWKISFNVNDEEANINRAINTKSLITFLTFKHDVLLNFMEKESSFFSNINIDHFSFAVDVFNRFPKTFEVLNQNSKILFTNTIKQDYRKRFVSFFDKDLTEHLLYIFSEQYTIDYPNEYPTQNISLQNIRYVSKLIKKQNGNSNDFIIKIYGCSSSFDTAKERYNELILLIIDSFNEIEMKEYLQVSNSNQNIYYNYSIHWSNAKQMIEDKRYNIDFSDFTNLIN
ncbi:hypothetical protein D1632_05480 [Chryseobacterium nematophagum]|uniref:Uncharacterized protein n=1 Tax=Chryseobacterium nematophagum TaxID=2305228 RepID=A0A3M7LDT5_9FLAO|nr:hypothetical protein [Chryseobacterium nematophagum]RMZ60389.1 hypothetical protein D1632_05480 [Chryseobacterium nematophagum]